MKSSALTAWATRLGLPASAVPGLAELWTTAQQQALASPSQSPTVIDEPDAPPASDTTGTEYPDGSRYERLNLLGTGGMGEVWRVRDRGLNMTMAMKVIRADLMTRAGVLSRFIEEAQCSAQLQHPGILPVHELGRLPEGQFYFTMDEVRGRTLLDAITEVHKASPGATWEVGPTDWTFHKLIEVFRRVCDAVAYAHSRGVVHRDLKPDNVMLGAHGEVLVLDWGLAKLLDKVPAAIAGPPQPVVTQRSMDSSKATRMGAVAGTPAYMAPEQARGHNDQVDARSDVYSLGAILYEICSGRAAYDGQDGALVLRKVLAGPPPPAGRAIIADTTFNFGVMDPENPSLSEVFGPPIPDELFAAIGRAMDRDPNARFEDAGQLGAEVASWLQGARRREQALEVAQKAIAMTDATAQMRQRAVALRGEAALLLESTTFPGPEREKLPGWAKEDEARELERAAKQGELRIDQALHGALRIDPTLPEAHAALAERLRSAHAAAERRRDWDAAGRAQLALKEHTEALPWTHIIRVSGTRYLEGDGAISLVTSPKGAEVLLHRYEVKNRRLVAIFERSLGPTPLSAEPLAMGSYLCVLRMEGRPDVPYPVHIRRGRHWTGVRPGAVGPTPIVLPEPDDLGPEDRYVPAGWFLAGGDPEIPNSFPRTRVWVDGLVVRRFPVTNREYLTFLNDLMATGHGEQALLYVPRERAGRQGEQGAMIYGQTEQKFHIVPDVDGDIWAPDWPVMQVDFWSAQAYAKWFAARTGVPWRLPAELEWEKAARGVDGRYFPWGDTLDSAWCSTIDSHVGRPLPTPVGHYPADVSVYGVRDMAGSITERCIDVFDQSDPVLDERRVPSPEEIEVGDRTFRVVRGGSWDVGVHQARCANRHRAEPWYRTPHRGFRLVHSL